MEIQGTLSHQNNFEKKKKKNKVRYFIVPDFRTYYKVLIIRTVWCWHEDSPIDQ